VEAVIVAMEDCWSPESRCPPEAPCTVVEAWPCQQGCCEIAWHGWRVVRNGMLSLSNLPTVGLALCGGKVHAAGSCGVYTAECTEVCLRVHPPGGRRAAAADGHLGRCVSDPGMAMAMACRLVHATELAALYCPMGAQPAPVPCVCDAVRQRAI
jgi:hypothetical protein